MAQKSTGDRAPRPKINVLMLSFLASAMASFNYPLAPTWSVIAGTGVLAGLGSDATGAGLNTNPAAVGRESGGLPALRLEKLAPSAGLGRRRIVPALHRR